MSNPRRMIWACLMAGLAALPATSQESAPKADGGAEVLKGAFRAYMAYDHRFPTGDDKNREGKLHCPVCENGLGPVVAVFARSMPKDSAAPLSSLLKLQDELTAKYRQQKLGAFAIFLTLNQLYEDDPTRIAKADEINRLGKQLNLKNVPLGLAEATVQQGDKAVPPEKVTNYGLADGDDITVIFYDRLKVIERWKFAADKGPGEEDLKAIENKVAGHFKK